MCLAKRASDRAAASDGFVSPSYARRTLSEQRRSSATPPEFPRAGANLSRDRLASPASSRLATGRCPHLRLIRLRPHSASRQGTRAFHQECKMLGRRSLAHVFTKLVPVAQFIFQVNDLLASEPPRQLRIGKPPCAPGLSASQWQLLRNARDLAGSLLIPGTEWGSETLFHNGAHLAW